MFEKTPRFNKPGVEQKPEARPRPELPTGEARKLQELVREKWQEHLLLFSQVKNKVLEVNPDVYIPLKLEEGKPSPLGLFAEAAFEEKPEKLPKGKFALEVWSEHTRSALLGRIIFGDKERRMYRDIDLKGVGAIELKQSETQERKIEKRPTVGMPGKEGEPYGRWGLLDSDKALCDLQISEEFLQAGIRTYRVLAVIELQELIVDGKKISLDEARKRTIINDKFHPVVEIRAYSTKARIDDLKKPSSRDYLDADLLLEDTRKLVSRELGREKIISNKEYIEWFAKTLGRNMALMHKNGWLHNYISSHNVTLDCRIVDFDSVSELTAETARYEEKKKAEDVLDSLINHLRGIILKPIDYERIFKIFNKNYDAAFPPEERKRYFKKIKEKQK